MLYDLFICHASEDKDSFVRPLADALRAENVGVWYDEFSLTLGDSLQRSINKGLSQCRYGVVVFSEAFFKKNWPQYELDGLTEREMADGNKIILPIRHDISHQRVRDHVPSLANRLSVSSERGMDAVVYEILRVVRPQRSPLLDAHNLLHEWGVTPPVVTDPYWLEVVEASNRIPPWGRVPEQAIWGRWAFPLPPKGDSPQQWEERLFWTALQLRWSEAAESQSITLLTCPEKVLDFIDSQTGLHETCEEFPELLARYAPQLTIPGMGGQFEEIFEDLYQKSLEENARRCGKISETTQTAEHSDPQCDAEWALRHPSLKGDDSSHVVSKYFQGKLCNPIEPIEYAIWLLSKDSKWLPERIHDYLLDGISRWPVWSWGRLSVFDKGGDWSTNGALGDALYHTARGKKPFRWTTKLKDDALNRFRKIIDLLSLPDRVEDILGRFIEYDFPGKWIESCPYRNRKR